MGGTCEKGALCSWAHGDRELGAPAPPDMARPCRFFLQGRCTKGGACPFSHVHPGMVWPGAETRAVAYGLAESDSSGELHPSLKRKAEEELAGMTVVDRTESNAMGAQFTAMNQE